MKKILHRHPKSGKMICGKLLQHKEEIAGGDVYNDPSGKWVQVPEVFAGCTVLKVSSVMYIRPFSKIVRGWWKQFAKRFSDGETPDTGATPQQLAQLSELNTPSSSQGWE